MYLPILALLTLLVPYTLSDGCHTQPDVIGCPTMIALDEMNRAISEFCHSNFPADDPSIALPIPVLTSWPGLRISPANYEDAWGNSVSFWANFRVNRTKDGSAYGLTRELCVSLLSQARTGNGTTLHGGMKDCTNSTGNGLTYGGWGNTDFGTVFAEPICPDGSHCMPDGIRPRGC